MNRPPLRTQKATFGDILGNCRFCPGKVLTTYHIVAECPTLLDAQVGLHFVITTVVESPVSSLDVIFSFGANLRVTQWKSLIIAKALRRFLKDIIKIASE